MDPSLRDAKGCLTEAGFRVLDGAPVGAAPPELAAHLAGCARCQEKLLAGARGPGAPPPRKPAKRPPVWRALIVVAAGLLVVLLAFCSLRRLV